MRENRDPFDIETVKTEIFKVVLLGNERTGKTNILSSFTQNWFDESYQATIGVDFATKK